MKRMSRSLSSASNRNFRARLPFFFVTLMTGSICCYLVITSYSIRFFFSFRLFFFKPDVETVMKGLEGEKKKKHSLKKNNPTRKRRSDRVRHFGWWAIAIVRILGRLNGATFECGDNSHSKVKPIRVQQKENARQHGRRDWPNQWPNQMKVSCQLQTQ